MDYCLKSKDHALEALKIKIKSFHILAINFRLEAVSLLQANKMYEKPIEYYRAYIFVNIAKDMYCRATKLSLY